ncbi:MAG: glycosyltransferase [Clostridia bacterium]|nr:glycosyltransferase [Clostridia bacterium]
MSKESIKISIIMATYNSEKTIEQALNSILSQIYKNIELIIVDGASTDGTIAILEKYSNKLKFISEPDRGLYDALNKGVNMASGDYVEIIGSDDALVDEQVISTVVKKIEQCNYCDIISGKEWGIVESCSMQYILDNYHARNIEAYNGGMVPHGAMFVKRNVFEKYHFDINYKIAADYKFFLQCYYDRSISIEYIDDFILFFATDGLSSNNDELLEENRRIYGELGLSFNTENDKINNPARYYFKHMLKKIGMFKALKKIIESIRFHNNKRYHWIRHRCNNPYCRWCKQNK